MNAHPAIRPLPGMLQVQHCHITATGVEFPKPLDLTQWREDFKVVCNVAIACTQILPLAIGQMMCYAEQHIVPRDAGTGRFASKEQRAIYEDIVATIGRKVNTMHKWKRICEGVSPDLFKEFLPRLTFTHFERVHLLKPELQRQWLKRAVDNDWTSLDLQAEMIDAMADSTGGTVCLNFKPNFTRARIDFARNLDQLQVEKLEPAEVQEIEADLSTVEKKIVALRGRLEKFTGPSGGIRNR